MDSEYALRRPGAGMVAEVIAQTFYTALCAPCLWLGAKGASKEFAAEEARAHNREQHQEPTESEG